MEEENVVYFTSLLEFGRKGNENLENTSVILGVRSRRAIFKVAMDVILQAISLCFPNSSSTVTTRRLFRFQEEISHFPFNLGSSDSELR